MPATGPTGVVLGTGGDPLTVGLIFFGIASLVVGMALVGVVPAAALGAVIPIIALGAGLFQLVVTLWAIILGLSIVAVIFSTFSAFWLSLAALLLGLQHGWYGVPAEDLAGAQAIYFIAWACLFAVLVIPCLWLPVIYPAAVFLVFVAMAFMAAAQFAGSPWLITAAGVTALVFAFLAFYSFVSQGIAAMGGRARLPLGRPLLGQ
jgi:succinate-acetate transporter protein